MEKHYYVYGLYSTLYLKKNYPEKIKYIGKTDNPTKRLSSHINSANQGKLSPLYEWMRTEMSKGGEIKMTLLHQCTSEEIIEQEKTFIEKNKSRNLLNIINNHSMSPTQSYKKIKSLTKDNFDLSRQVKILEQYIIDSGLELPYKRE
jgi:glucuronate isomerase